MLEYLLLLQDKHFWHIQANIYLEMMFSFLFCFVHFINIEILKWNYIWNNLLFSNILKLYMF